jgi:hypothetical protein
VQNSGSLGFGAVLPNRFDVFEQGMRLIFFNFLVKKVKNFFGGISKPLSLPSQKRHAISENVSR